MPEYAQGLAGLNRLKSKQFLEEPIVPSALGLPDSVSQADAEIFAWTNQARFEPASLIPHLEAELEKFQSDGKMREVSSGVLMESKEGTAAWEEAIAFLRAQAPLPALSWSEGLAAGAREHTLDCGPRGVVSYEIDLGERLRKHGELQTACAENLNFGPGNGYQVVAQFIVDDGTPDRSHRNNIFSEVFKCTGNFTGPHTAWDQMTTQTFAGGFLPLGSSAQGTSADGTGGEGADLNAKANAFAQEDVVFEEEMPEGHKGWSTQINVQMLGNHATKTVTRTVKLADGGSVICTKVVEKDL